MYIVLVLRAISLYGSLWPMAFIHSQCQQGHDKAVSEAFFLCCNQEYTASHSIVGTVVHMEHRNIHTRFFVNMKKCMICLYYCANMDLSYVLFIYWWHWPHVRSKSRLYVLRKICVSLKWSQSEYWDVIWPQNFAVENVIISQESLLPKEPLQQEFAT